MSQSTDLEREFWNEWNKVREQQAGAVSEDQMALIEKWLAGRSGLRLLDVGCGSGWLCARLLKYGSVLGTDLANDVLLRTARRVPGAAFVAGDFMTLELGGPFDVITSLEVLAHVPNQPAFLARIASLLKPGGELLLATQNRWVLERNDIPPPGRGQVRQWTSRAELLRLLRPRFEVVDVTTLTPAGNGGFLRIVNSHKLNRLADAIAGPKRVRHMKERLGFGWTLMVRAIVR